jgi:hypothetical protein
MLQPIQDRVHPAYEYSSQSDLTRVMRHKVFKEDMVAWVKNIFVGRIRNWTCPMVLCVYWPTDVVSHRALSRP